MASSGNITLYIKSVDYGGGRGTYYSDLNARWNVSDSGWLTLSEQGYSTNQPAWFICSAVYTNIITYYVEWAVEFSTDNVNWTTLSTQRVAVKGPCQSVNYLTGTNVKRMMQDFVSSWGGCQLTSSGYIRVSCGANLPPAPDASYRYAFPNKVYSQASQAPAWIDYSWGATGKFDANGGTGAPSDVVVNGNANPKTITIPGQTPTRDHWKFIGWSKTRHTTAQKTADYHPGDTVTISKDNPTVTFYAVWDYAHYYRLIYQENSGTVFDDASVSNMPGAQSYNDTDDSHSFTVSNLIPVRKNWIFHGWSKTKKAPTASSWYKASDADIHGGDTITITGVDGNDTDPVILYAIWEYTYRPGQIMVAGAWQSCDRDGNYDSNTKKYGSMAGRCHIRRNGDWVEMRTRKDMTGANHAPVIRSNATWESQQPTGADAHDVSY